MAATRTANSHWEGSLVEGAGTVSLDSSGLGSHDVTWAARTEEPGGKTSPEELIAAAVAACFNMALSHRLAGAGTPPQELDTRADVSFQPGEGVTGIAVTVRGRVEGIDSAAFVASANEGCPVTDALAGTSITYDAALVD
jgi:lipoyl-dependent peroxiredoxin